MAMRLVKYFTAFPAYAYVLHSSLDSQHPSPLAGEVGAAWVCLDVLWRNAPGDIADFLRDDQCCRGQRP